MDEKVSIHGVELYPFTSENQIAEFAGRHTGILVAINAEKILNATAETRSIINRNIGYCDGAGPQIMLHSMGYKDAIKIAGCELWLSLTARLYKEKTFYLVGARQDVIDKTVAKLKAEYEGIRIVGYRNGYISTDEERRKLLDDIVEKRPDIVFVAMGSPLQELLMEEMLSRHKAIYQGLGGSFDIYVGNASRAPRWWIDHNLEWLYRLILQPSRIKRQVKLIRFLWWIISTKNKR